LPSFPGWRAAITRHSAISLLYFTVAGDRLGAVLRSDAYISLATVAFFGIGAYTVAVLGEVMPWPAVLAIAGLFGIAVALVVGLSTLRLSGIYFVIFTFGLSELIRQLVTWYEINFTARSAATSSSASRPSRSTGSSSRSSRSCSSRLADRPLAARLALRVIGNDEVVARHCRHRYDARQARDVSRSARCS
jgi:branched-chain amino acid transport system permease protein